MWTTHTIRIDGERPMALRAGGAVRRLGHAVTVHRSPPEAVRPWELTIFCQLELADDYAAAWTIGELVVLGNEYDGQYLGWEPADPEHSPV